MFEQMKSNHRRPRGRKRWWQFRTPINYTADQMNQDHLNSLAHYNLTNSVPYVSTETQKAEAEAYLVEQETNND